MAFSHCLLVLVVMAAATLTTVAAEIIDLSYTYDEKTPTFPGLRSFKQELVQKGRDKINLWVELYDICTSEHSGTHLDAPRHNNERGWTVEEITPDRLWRRPAVVVDVAKNIKNTRLKNYEVKLKDLTDWEDQNGVIPDGAIVFIRTGWGKMVDNKRSYIGLDHNNKVNFPGLGKGAAEWLVNHGKNNSHKTGIVGVGIDTLSLDKGQSVRMPAHAALFAANIYGLENVANLDKVPATGSYVTVMPMKIGGGSGAPVRIIAEVGEGPVSPAPTHRPLISTLVLPLFLALCIFWDM